MKQNTNIKRQFTAPAICFHKSTKAKGFAVRPPARLLIYDAALLLIAAVMFSLIIGVGVTVIKTGEREKEKR